MWQYNMKKKIKKRILKMVEKKTKSLYSSSKNARYEKGLNDTPSA